MDMCYHANIALASCVEERAEQNGKAVVIPDGPTITNGPKTRILTQTVRVIRAIVSGWLGTPLDISLGAQSFARSSV